MSDARAMRAAIDRLHDAGARLRERSQREVVASLMRVLDAWSAADGRWQRELAPRLAAASGFSEATVRDGLRRALASWTGARFREAVERELAPDDVGRELTSIVLAGAIPMPTLLQLGCVLAVRSPALVKTASRDPVTAHVVRESIAAVDAQLASAIEIVPFHRERERDAERGVEATALLLASPCIVASGSDETIEAIRSQLSSRQTFVAYGHRLSIAAIGEDAFEGETPALVARDVAAWDQLGCLSPVVVLAIGGTADRAEAFARRIADELAALEARTPRGDIDRASASAIRSERENARLRFANVGAGCVLGSAGSQWTVVFEPPGAEPARHAATRPAPLHRFARVVAVRDVAEAASACEPLRRWLSTVAVAGLPDDAVETLGQLGGHRLCAPGEMQTPELGWQRDGLGLLRPLLR